MARTQNTGEGKPDVIDRIPDWRIGDVQAGAIAKETIHRFQEDDVPGLAAQMAYSAILALPPFLLLLAGLTSIVDNVFPVGNLTQEIVNRAGEYLPDDATSLLESFTTEVVNSNGIGAIVFGLLGSLWAASSATGTVMKALNRAYDVEEQRGFLRRKATALGLTVLFGGLLLCASLIFATGNFMAQSLGDALGWKSGVTQTWQGLAPVIALGMVVAGVAMLYWLAPNTGHQFRWLTPGAILFVIAWIIATVGFTVYVSNFSSYNRTYGSLAAMIILLIWLYWSNMLLLIGGELNATIARRHDPEYKAEQPQNAKPKSAPAGAQPSR